MIEKGSVSVEEAKNFIRKIASETPGELTEENRQALSAMNGACDGCKKLQPTFIKEGSTTNLVLECEAGLKPIEPYQGPVSSVPQDCLSHEH